MSTLPAAFLSTPLAHRALHDITDGRPENSRAAVKAAIAAGYGIEIDVQCAKDGEAMVFHDYDLARLTPEKGGLAQRTAAELAEIPLTHGNEGIPRLSDILTLINGQVPLVVEIKDQSLRLAKGDSTLEKRVAALCAAYTGPIAVMSFNPHAVAAFSKHAPEVPVGLVTENFTAEEWPLVSASDRAHLTAIADYDRVGASFVSHSVRHLDHPRLQDLRAQGAHLLCWTVRSAAEAAVVRQTVDNITFESYLPPLHWP